jgi:carbon storage regulator CsrA
MLVLSRKCGQSILVGDEIEVNIVDIGRGRVQIGVTAPRHMAIVRNELLARCDWTGPSSDRELVLQSAAEPPE